MLLLFMALFVDSNSFFGEMFKNKVVNEELCSICGVYTGVEVHPCRVCCKVYHELCLKKKGKLYDHAELDAFRKANTDQGWSCYDCVSILLFYLVNQGLFFKFRRVDVSHLITGLYAKEELIWSTTTRPDHHNGPLCSFDFTFF